MKEIAIVVLSWNAQPLLERYLPDLLQHTPLDLADIILADNGSSDASVAYAKSLGVKVIELGENYGFARGYNEAIARLEHNYVLLLNNDVRVSPGWLDPLYHFMETHKDVVSVQPKIRWDRAPQSYEYAGAEGGYLDYLGYPFCRGRIFETLEKDHGQYGLEPKEVFWTSGAAMLVRRKVYIDAGGFDASFFAHQEEIDLCWRWHIAGHRLYVVPESTVYHYGGASLSSADPRKTFLNFRNNRKMLYKNLPDSKRIWILSVRWLLDLVAMATFMVQGKWGDAKAVVKALRAYRSMEKTVSGDSEGREVAFQKLYKRSLLIRYHIYREKTFDQLKA